VKPAEERDFREFVAARMDRMRRLAYLLCRNWHTADDLVSVTVDKLYRRWGRVHAADNPDAYARTMLTRAWLDERRRPWRRESAVAEPPEPHSTAEPSAPAVVDRLALLDLLARLPARRRAVVVLRFYCDLSVEETADLLGVSAGTVKSQAARGLEALRVLAIDQGTFGRRGK
jgi:RNA polymerase sigma-70 factor (sigma-E family)